MGRLVTSGLPISRNLEASPELHIPSSFAPLRTCEATHRVMDESPSPKTNEATGPTTHLLSCSRRRPASQATTHTSCFGFFLASSLTPRTYSLKPDGRCNDNPAAVGARRLLWRQPRGRCWRLFSARRLARAPSWPIFLRSKVPGSRGINDL